jgi:mono/diheme cytochrome c family protein
MQKFLKWLGYILGGLLALLLMAAGIIYFQSESILNKTYAAPPVSVTVPTDAETVARGKYLVEHVSVCVDCHGENLGGGVVVDDPAIGYAPAPNITTGLGGLGANLTDADIARVIRYGILSNGKSARVMPSEDYQNLSETDLAAIIAYVRSVPPVNQEMRPWDLRPVGRLLLVARQLPIMTAERIDPSTVQPSTVPAGVTKEYGNYLGNIAGCTGCHGPGLSGGPILGAPPDWPPAANITTAGAIADWTEADFITMMRTGVDKTGHEVNAVMPVFRYAGMSDDELKAIWLFISTAPPKEYGNR